MSAILEALQKSGFRLTENAKLSVKDDAGTKVGRIDVSRSLRLDRVSDPVAIVQAAAAGSGGQLTVDRVSDDLSKDPVARTIAVNAAIGEPLTAEDAYDIAFGAANRALIVEDTADHNRRQDAIREKLRAESAQRAASRDVVESASHVRNVAEHAEAVQS